MNFYYQPRLTIPTPAIPYLSVMDSSFLSRAWWWSIALMITVAICGPGICQLLVKFRWRKCKRVGVAKYISVNIFAMSEVYGSPVWICLCVLEYFVLPLLTKCFKWCILQPSSGKHWIFFCFCHHLDLSNSQINKFQLQVKHVIKQMKSNCRIKKFSVSTFIRSRSERTLASIIHGMKEKG